MQLASPRQDRALEGVCSNKSKSGGSGVLTEQAPMLEEQAPMLEEQTAQPQNHTFPFQRSGKNRTNLRARQG